MIKTLYSKFILQLQQNSFSITIVVLIKLNLQNLTNIFYYCLEL